MGESQYLFAYNTTKLWWITRKAPFGEATLKDCDVVVNFKHETSITDRVTVIATEPLTNDEKWHKINSGELVTFELADLISQISSTTIAK